MNLISAKNLCLSYPKNSSPTLKNIDFSIEAGCITQFLGKSGSGKTTLLKCIANLINNFSGQLTYKDKAIKEMSPQFRASHIGFVSQSFDLFPHMSVLENCLHPQIHVLELNKKAAEKNAQEKLAHLGILEYANRSPRDLSGGQKQRVSIARALCMNSKLLLLDEPTSALDPESSKKLVEILLKLNSEGVTLALSTHDMTFSKNLLDRVYFMMAGEIIEYLDVKNSNIESTKAIKNFFAY